MLSESVPVLKILKIILLKIMIGIICGFLIDGFCLLRVCVFLFLGRLIDLRNLTHMVQYILLGVLIV